MKSRGTERGHAHGTIVAGRRWSTARDLFSFAAVELRTLRRSVGAWVFAGLSCVVGTGLFVLAAGLHGMHSAQFPAFGFLAPQFFLSQFGVHLLFAAMLGTAFLAVGRADGAREDVPDVLGVRAFSNVALVGGRVLALAVAGWVSVFLVLGLLQGGSSVARWLGWWPGDSPAVASVATFLLIDLPPTLGLWCSGLVAMGALVRNRLLKALLALLAAAVLWGALGVPGQVAHALIPVMAYERLVSDIAPRWVDAHTALQRSALLLSACGLTAVAAALHVRRDGRSRGARTCLGGGFWRSAPRASGSWRGRRRRSSGTVSGGVRRTNVPLSTRVRKSISTGCGPRPYRSGRRTRDRCGVGRPDAPRLAFARSRSEPGHAGRRP